MKALQTARICIIDDEPKEYLHLIHALSRNGLGCLHIDGSKVEQLPETPFSGLRIVFLDMHLGTAGDANQVAAHTANVFSRVIPQDGGPVLVVFWTKHSDYVEAFKSRLFEKWGSFLGRLVFAQLDKPQESTEIDPQKIANDISNKLKNYYPLDLIWNWEHAVHEAASGASTALATLAADRAGVAISDDETTMSEKIRSAYRFLLRLLLEASAGKIGTNDTALRDLHAGLAALLNDRLEHNSNLADEYSASLLLKEKRPTPTATESAAINAMLLIASADADSNMLGPGSLYTFNDVAQFKDEFGQEWNSVAEKIIDPFTVKPMDQPSILTQCRPLLVEVSADCDFAQRKRPVARLVAGILVPSELARRLMTCIPSQVRTADYLRHGTDVTLYNPAGDWHPIFIGQFIFSVSPATLPKWVTPIGRLRTGPLTELRHWLAAHSTRPGYLSVH